MKKMAYIATLLTCVAPTLINSKMMIIKPTEEESMKKDIIDTAVEAGSFTTLAELLTKAELIETLKGEGPFTVFAPTDDAFAKLDEETLEKVLNDKELLTKILTYHVVPSKALAADVTNLDGIETVEGERVNFSVEDGQVKVNDARVIKADIDASNGVIHVIDKVLLPE